METNYIQKEILLVTTNSFAQREWCSKEIYNYDKMTAQEQMEEVCANGLIYEILPEVFEAPESAKLYLWMMQPGFSFIQLQYGASPFAIKKSASLNPHEWLSCSCYN